MCIISQKARLLNITKLGKPEVGGSHWGGTLLLSIKIRLCHGVGTHLPLMTADMIHRNNSQHVKISSGQNNAHTCSHYGEGGEREARVRLLQPPRQQPARVHVYIATQLHAFLRRCLGVTLYLQPVRCQTNDLISGGPNPDVSGLGGNY